MECTKCSPEKCFKGLELNCKHECHNNTVDTGYNIDLSQYTARKFVSDYDILKEGQKQVEDQFEKYREQERRRKTGELTDENCHLHLTMGGIWNDRHLE